MISQICIALTSLTAIYLSQQSNANYHKYACLFGLAGQPFWFYTTWQAAQWGIFMMSFFYTYSWLLGFRRYWL